MQSKNLLPNAAQFFNSLRSIGYSLEVAVADIIDNSLAARATCVEVETPTDESEPLTILDNGYGMNATTLEKAMSLGAWLEDSQRSSNDLGRFGLGLKTASLSQCKKLFVFTKECNSPIVGALWDLDFIYNESKNWTVHLFNEQDLFSRECAWLLAPLKKALLKLQAQASGTLVAWMDLDRVFKPLTRGSRSKKTDQLTRHFNQLKQHLSLVFHRFLEGEDGVQFEIILNGSSLKPKDPFMKGSSHKRFDHDKYMCEGYPVYLTAYMLSQKVKVNEKDQGIYIYRNKRLIDWGKWYKLLRQKSDYSLVRVQIDLPASRIMDDLWQLDVKKSQIRIPDSLKEQLKAIITKLGMRSQSAVRSRRTEISYLQNDWPWRIETDRKTQVASYRINRECSYIKELLEAYPKAEEVLLKIEEHFPCEDLSSLLGNSKDSMDDSSIDKQKQSQEIKAKNEALCQQFNLDLLKSLI